MISTHLLQDLTADKPLGFTRSGGTMRFYLYKSNVCQRDWYDTIDYAISREWVERTGQIDGSGEVYNWRGK